MSQMEREELATIASAMTKEDRMVVLDSFPLEDLIEMVYIKYTDMKSKYDSILSILNNENPINPVSESEVCYEG